MTRNFTPETHKRVRNRIERQNLIADAETAKNRRPAELTPDEERAVLQKIRGKISFSSLTLRHIYLDTKATTFIVHTHKPIKWIDFIILVSEALEEVL